MSTKCKFCDKKIVKISTDAKNSISRAKGEIDKSLVSMKRKLNESIKSKVKSGQTSRQDAQYQTRSIDNEIELIYQSINTQLVSFQREFFSGSFSDIV